MKRMNTPLPRALRHHTAFLITDIGRLHRVVLDHEMEKLGLSRAEWWLLSFLIYFDGSSQQELANVMDSSKSVIAKLTEQLERRGLIHRAASNTDSRIKHVYLSSQSKPLVSKMKRKLSETADRSMRKLSVAQIKTLTKLLGVIENTLEQDVQAAHARR